MSGQFFVLQCPGCGKWGVKEIRNVQNIMKAYLQCHSCNKRSKVKKAGVLGLSLNSKGCYLNPQLAAHVCQEANKRRNIRCI